ncbi:GTP cyclohydrolase II [Haematospirillum jordaniae]|uniref:GTP cyclohydrolase-2 n=1 Tax=Haematospirillum jordaniae TaxID=1549855 RepID=A0A143DCG2_9PROT|nr:GTP cyclohydrolase II [Haematospirillum jordaniae]AMW34405.1 GTP cyclohydrolase [Haematospirillum jordaniae]NKD44620.1 GTP cyclohydrolase II [Haematospirillum jordaniae]NKD57640.1 GTP cyclohydrolase II [Haematospirillum jordaniae]NKD59210.1 GTP cyclohydrolase II [Haematospirillum jordaniae]NKD67348.1 GTP cyclohydrolase II [Haematospirillum jordaniae]
MTRPVPPASSPPPSALVAVDRVVAEFRRGGTVVLTDLTGKGLLIQSAETLTEESLERFGHLTNTTPALLMTGRRAEALGYEATDAPVIAFRPPAPLTVDQVTMLGDPVHGTDRVDPAMACAEDSMHEGAPESLEHAAVLLAKIARLLPVVVATPLHEHTDIRHWAAERDLLTVDSTHILSYLPTAARSLRPVGDARVPLQGAENTRIVAFRPADGGIEHLAIIIGNPDPEQPVLVRLHSECFTGDLLGSLRCDCGDQLRGAIDVIAREGSGVLLYLAQEGRGIGLVNKLRAYHLQDRGFDTMDANGQLGFHDDERLFLPAAEMLLQLGFSRVRLLTNNPDKVAALARHGIRIDERVAHVFASNVHNLSYLRTKAEKGGHIL